MTRYSAGGPHNRAFTTTNRAVRPFTILLAVCCCLSAASGQWLETTIHVPDSLCGLLYPQCLAFNSVDNTIYMGGSNGLAMRCYGRMQPVV